jgi:hypothetical protein
LFEFWSVIKPMLRAVKARTLVEVGAEAGNNTVNIVRWAADHRAVLHVIDPKPLFDVAAMERRHPRHFVMHQALSLDVLPTIADPDAVLLDGDHNWYTVIEELRVLERMSSQWPLTFLHDVDWPYGRRDMYYDPANVPAEHMQPYQRSGIVRGRSELSPGGHNAEYFNAKHEGGPRNGVLTAVEDFIGESRHDLALFTVRGPAGMAIVVDEDRMKTRLGPLVRQVHDPAFAVELGVVSAGSSVR